MTTLVAEYVVRLRLEEPTGTLPPGQVGAAMHELLTQIEAVAVEQEIVSRRVVGDPEPPRRVRCSARTLDPARHYATGARWSVTHPDGETLTMCSAACTLSWLCHELPGDIGQHQSSETGNEVAA